MIHTHSTETWEQFPAYEELSDEKKNKMNEEKLELIPATKNHHRSFLTYTCLTICLLFLGTWLALSMKYKHVGVQFTNMEQQIYETTKNVVSDAEFILKEVKEKATAISVKNEEAATKYVLGIREILKQGTLYNIKKISQLISENTNDIERELLVFKADIASMNDGNLDVTQKDIAKFAEDPTAVDFDNAAEVVDKIFREVEMEIEEFCRDMNQMYTFYANYVSDIIDHKIYNVTDEIRMQLFQAKRWSYKNTEIEHIDFCYNISSQNVEISDQLKLAMKVVGIVNNTTDTVNMLAGALTQDGDKYPPPLVVESQHLLDKASNTSQSMLDSLLKGEEYYLGSMVRAASFRDHKHMTNFVTRNYRITIQDLPTFVKKTTNDFTIVYEEHWKRMQDVLFPALKSIGDKIKANARLINDTAVRDEYTEKAEFESLKLWMHDQFVNASSVVNSVFEEKKKLRAEMIEIETTTVINEKVPLVSSLSIDAYLPSDVCPLSVNYQQYINTLITDQQNILQALDRNENQVNSELELNVVQPVGNCEMNQKSIDDVSKNNDEEQQESDSFSSFVTALMKTFLDAGYSVDYVYLGSREVQD